ncbi:MAG: tetratricopeptide repeat protein [Flavobacteriales bacterium]|nr:tetratricopeptide repeat protein [Flavobacteriales bacterium]
MRLISSKYPKIFFTLFCVTYSLLASGQISSKYLKADSLFFETIRKNDSLARNSLKNLDSISNSKDEVFLSKTCQLYYFQNTRNFPKASTIQHTLDSLVQFTSTPLSKFRYFKGKGKTALFSNPAKAPDLYDEALKYAPNVSDSSLVFYYMGMAFELQNINDSSRFYLNKSFSLDSTGEVSANALNGIAKTYFKEDNVGLAVSYLERAAKKFNTLGKLINELSVKTGLGAIYLELEEYEKAEAVFAYIVNSLPLHQRKVGLYSSAKLGLISSWAFQNECDSVLFHSKEMTFMLSEQEPNNYKKLIGLFCDMSKCLSYNKEDEQAIFAAQKAATIAHKYQDTSFYPKVYLAEGRALAKTSPSRAQKKALRALSWNKIVDSDRFEKAILRLLYQLAKTNGDFKGALEYFELLTQIQNENRKDSINVAVANIEATNRASLAEKDAKLTKEKLKSETLEKEKSKLYTLMLLFAFLGSTIFLSFIIFIVKRRRDKAEQVNKTLEDQLGALSTRLIEKQRAIRQLEEEIQEEKITGNFSKKFLEELKVEQDWSKFMSLFETRYKTLWNHLISIPDITKSDLRFCALSHLDLSSSEIGDLLNITYAGVKKARNRIRKKLKLDSNVRIGDYLKRVS